ncbi:MAG: hypothetical protein HUK25_04085 [Treponema sp.]|nr:hypothetical protein [Treponema sp.]
MDDNVTTTEYVATPVASGKSEKGCYSAFAIVGFVSGIAGLVLSWIGFTVIIPVLGIVFGSLGEKSSSQGDKGHSGKVMGIIGTVLSVVFMIIWICVFAAAAYSLGDVFEDLFDNLLY